MCLGKTRPIGQTGAALQLLTTTIQRIPKLQFNNNNSAFCNVALVPTSATPPANYMVFNSIRT